MKATRNFTLLALLMVFAVSCTKELKDNNGTLDGHDYVDLGLPSGTLWATCNVGADTPEGYGDYFAWAETQTKGTYDWDTYKYANGSRSMLTKYCCDSVHGYNGYTDNMTILLPEDDATTVNWGGDWRIPTREQWQELLDNTTCIWTTRNGVNGCLFTASNGNRLFLPAAGLRFGNGFDNSGSHGYFLSSSLDMRDPSCAWFFGFNSNYQVTDGTYRVGGFSVRPVFSEK